MIMMIDPLKIQHFFWISRELHVFQIIPRVFVSELVRLYPRTVHKINELVTSGFTHIGPTASRILRGFRRVVGHETAMVSLLKFVDPNMLPGKPCIPDRFCQWA